MNTANSTVLITGATSPMARSYAAIAAKDGYKIILAGRNIPEIEITAQDLRVRFSASVEVKSYDASLPGAGRNLARMVFGPGLSIAVAFQGLSGEAGQMQEMMQVNCLSVAELFEELVALGDSAKTKIILVGISSPAGDRGRKSNYPYGSTKAALTAYLSGLRNRVYGQGHRVVTVKPGFVRTRMTDGKVKPNSPLLAEPARVAADIAKAIAGNKDEIYTPWFWRPIMVLIRALPERLFKKTSL